MNPNIGSETHYRQELADALIRKFHVEPGKAGAYVFLERTCAKHLRMLDTHLAGLEGKKVLDVGSGTGGFAVAASLHGAAVCGLDLFAGFEQGDAELARLRAACYRLEINQVQASALNIPFPDNTFDAVTNLGMFEHIIGRAARSVVIKECIRVVRPGVVFLLIAHPNRGFPLDYHYGFLPFVNWLPRPLRLWYAKLFRPAKVGQVDSTANLSFREVRGYLQDWAAVVHNVWPEFAIPTRPKELRDRSVLSVLSATMQKLRLQRLVRLVALLMAKTGTEYYVCLVARKR